MISQGIFLDYYYNTRPPVGTKINLKKQFSQGMLGFYSLADANSSYLHDSLNITPTMQVVGSSTYNNGLQCVTKGQGANVILPASMQFNFPLTIVCGYIWNGVTADNNANVLGILSNNTGASVVNNIRLSWGLSGSQFSVNSANAPGGPFVVSTPPSKTPVVLSLSVKDPNSLYFYMNGVLNYSSTSLGGSQPVWSATSNICIGQPPGLSSRNMAGIVTWVAWWNRVLTPEENYKYGQDINAIWSIFEPQINYTYLYNRLLNMQFGSSTARVLVKNDKYVLGQPLMGLTSPLMR